MTTHININLFKKCKVYPGYSDRIQMQQAQKCLILDTQITAAPCQSHCGNKVSGVCSQEVAAA